jgi:putative phosphoesterase
VRRVALIADTHGNAVALEAVLADVDRRGADEIVCLGDVAAGGPQPREVLARLRGLGCAVVRGNAEDWLLVGMPVDADEEGRRLRAIVEWARAQLSDADIAYLESFVPTVERELGWSRRMLCFHGSPRGNSDRLLATTPEDEFARLFADAAADVFAGGHTHVQLARRLGASLLVNPGSVGLPLRGGGDGDPSVAGDPRLPHFAD